MTTDSAAQRDAETGDSRGVTEPAMELLVHGVGGATPQDLLEDPRTVRITGDHTASIHRSASDAGERPWDGARPVREAYSWSNLTSGNGARALWLLLLPFMIANMAHWMRPPGVGRRRAHQTYNVFVRLLALSLTVLLIAGACVVALDLTAWQCAGTMACAQESGWLSFTADTSWWAQPGRRMVLAALLPLLLTGLLWWLSHRTWSAYESASPPVRDRGDDESDRALLSLPGFWYGRNIGSRLRAAHTAAGLLTVSSGLLVAAGPFDRGPSGNGPLAVTGALLLALTGAGWAVVLCLATRPGRSESTPDEQPISATAVILPWASLALVALTLVHTAWDRADWQSTGQHPGSAVFPVLIIFQGVVIVALALTAWWLHRATPAAERGGFAGLGGAAVALIGCALGGVLTGGVAQRFADWLDPGSTVQGWGGTIEGPPVLLGWLAAALPSLLLVIVVWVLVAVARVHVHARRLSPQVTDRYPGENSPPLADRSKRIAAAVVRARLTDSAPRLIGWITGASLILGLVVVGGSQLTGKPPAAAAEAAPVLVSAFAELSQAVGSWLMGAGVVLLLAMGRRAYRDAAARRTIGILWDVGTFWPRAAHPFAPPCYAERAVPDLSWRMGTWIDRTGGRLVISGHSQGSVLAAAAVWQLDAPTRSRIALLTYGSPLERLYARWFPAYFGDRALRSLHRDLPCWRNLWRATDPIGGPVGLTGAPGPLVDRGPLRDPLHYGRNIQRPLPEPILGHSDYAADPTYAQERAELFERLLAGRQPVPDQSLAHES